ncbi:MAG: helix-turn-helix domain-containing protein [Hyphomicrobium sp.]
MQLMSKSKAGDGNGVQKAGPLRDRADGFPADMAGNLKRLRKLQGHSLESLAQASGVSRAMLGQIETGKSVPTITLLWKVANALGVSLSALVEGPKPARLVVLPKSAARLVMANGGGFSFRAISAAGFDLGTNFYALTIAPGHSDRFEPQPYASRAALAVAAGTVSVGIGDHDPVELTEGGAILFEAGNENVFSNPGAIDAIAFLVVTPARDRSSGF